MPGTPKICSKPKTLALFLPAFARDERRKQETEKEKIERKQRKKEKRKMGARIEERTKGELK